MPRYRATVAGRPIGPWRGHREVASIDLVEANEASLGPDTGRIFSSALTGIERDEADEPSSVEQDLLAAAVETLQREGNRAPVYAKERAAGFEERHLDTAERWRRIGRLADNLLPRAALRGAGRWVMVDHGPHWPPEAVDKAHSVLNDVSGKVGRLLAEPWPERASAKDYGRREGLRLAQQFIREVRDTIPYDPDDDFLCGADHEAAGSIRRRCAP